ncbi:MAG TPA: ATP synthase F1 subunit epsilon [Candidatus Paceibacterota bacterium]
MQLKIYSLKKVLFEGEAKSLTVRSIGGELTILDNHLPLITMLQAGPVTITDKSGQITKIDVSAGFLEVKPNSEVKILAD